MGVVLCGKDEDMPEPERYRDRVERSRSGGYPPRGRDEYRYQQRDYQRTAVREREPRPSGGSRPGPPPGIAPRNEDEPPPTLAGQVQLWKVDLKRMNRLIEKAFPDTADEIAYRLARITPKAIALCYLLLIAGIVASRLSIIWTVGYLWGIASMSVIMIGVFLWVWSSNVMRLPDLSAEARTALRGAMRLQSTTFIAAVITMAYFIGMAFNFW